MSLAGSACAADLQGATFDGPVRCVVAVDCGGTQEIGSFCAFPC